MVVPLNITDRVWKGLETHQKNFEGRFGAFKQGHNIETGEHDDLKFTTSETKPDAPSAGRLRLFYDKDKPQRIGIVDENDTLSEMKFMALDEAGLVSLMMTYKPFPSRDVSLICMAYTISSGIPGVMATAQAYGRNAAIQRAGSRLIFLFQTDVLNNVQMVSLGSASPEAVLNQMAIDQAGPFTRFSFDLNSASNSSNTFRILFLGWG